jgi:hypothetical protein
MSTESYIKETIASLRNEMTHVWTAAFICGGGTLSLFWINAPIWLKCILFAVGLFFTFVFFIAYSWRHTKIENLTKDLLKLERSKHANYN